MTLVITWATFRWLIIPLVVLFLIGMTGALPDNDFAPVRAATALFSGIGIVVWVIAMLVHAWST